MCIRLKVPAEPYFSTGNSCWSSSCGERKGEFLSDLPVPSEAASQSKQRTATHRLPSRQAKEPGPAGTARPRARTDAGGGSGRCPGHRRAPGSRVSPGMLRGCCGRSPSRRSAGPRHKDPPSRGRRARLLPSIASNSFISSFPVTPRHFSVHLTVSVTTIPWGNFNCNIIWNCWLFIVTRQRT